MPSLSELYEIVSSRNCMGCGFCTLDAATGKRNPAVRMQYSEHYDHFIPEVQQLERGSDNDTKVLCPGARIDMVELSQQKFGGLPSDYLLGHIRGMRIAYSADSTVREVSASGGLIPCILSYLFDRGMIESAYVLKPGADLYAAAGVVVSSKAELKDIHGSVYHPTDFGKHLDTLCTSNKKFAFVGLPCHIAGLEQLKLTLPAVEQNHVLSIGLFCGGVIGYKGIKYYLETFGVDWSTIRNLNYRHGFWPGKIRIDYNQTVASPRILPRIRGNTRWKILHYVIGFQGYWMLRRCRICPDQIADFADIAVGDPHLPRYRKTDNWGFSLVLTRTQRGEALFRQMIEQKLLVSEDAARDDVVRSQGYTLDNRRHLTAYLKVNRFFGNRNPDVRLYPKAEKAASFRHYVYAAVDLGKIQVSKYKLLAPLYLPWQIFEYLFITFTPSIIIRRMKNLLRNQ